MTGGRSNHPQLLMIVLLVIMSSFITIHVGGDTGDPANCLGKAAVNPMVAAASRYDAVRLVVELDNTEEQRFYPYCVKVDQFTLLTLTGSGAFMNTSENSTVTIHVGEDKYDNNKHFRTSSLPREFLGEGPYDNTTYVSYYTAVLTLSNGYFRYRGNNTEPGDNIDWEDSCAKGACLVDITAPCVRNQDCGLSTVTTTANSTLGTSQDVKIYLAWQGTAKAQKALQSASYMPSQFRKYSFASYYKKLFDILPKKS